MHLDLSGLLIAGTMWLLAAVIAWPWGCPVIAAALLIGQGVGFLAVAIWDTRTPPGLAGPPARSTASMNVERRNPSGSSPR
ncbi:hypothetical protein GB931_00295 [Modestobacter sp. I12A-02628]|uniref:Uncharacterized protein n=1 Tax=Goekera deserti TaxID=2497753 RepID=A0A7K3WI07_9ACTN|nr:hypothetical protein [Goekera deserti]MPQ96387.1 hypothetical protein [Goekera deserti]NDI47301.1 hypothetical protein [Goekera deserti]NEL56131.1 hypothetical protein [Goekera deserti]